MPLRPLVYKLLTRSFVKFWIVINNNKKIEIEIGILYVHMIYIIP